VYSLIFINKLFETVLTMGLSVAERNRRKRERRKKGLSALETNLGSVAANENGVRDTAHPEHSSVLLSNGKDSLSKNIEIEYVAPDLTDMLQGATGSLRSASTSLNGTGDTPIPEDVLETMRRFHARTVSLLQSDDDLITSSKSSGENGDDDVPPEEGEGDGGLSKRKRREMTRPTIAELKRRVQRPDLVEAHDITADEPEFLIQLKSIPNTVPVPRHWGRKRKYLQGKRIGYEKVPFQLPSFLVNTGITELRDTTMQQEKEMSVKQKNRARVQVKLGAMDVDYRTLYDAFFKYQTKPNNLTKFGDVYYEGKESESKNKVAAGRPLSSALRMALGMSSPLSPPPWLIPMQRYGPPPSYPNLRMPGLNAPLPDPLCQYGYHPNGWGKPPIDPYGRPLYGGNPFDPPGTNRNPEEFALIARGELVTSDGKTISKTANWGALPMGVVQQDEEEESSGDDEEMDESSEEEEQPEGFKEEEDDAGITSTIPLSALPTTGGPVDLRKTGLETPTSILSRAPQQLYQVIEQRQASSLDTRAVFASDVVYQIPTTTDGAESVLLKAIPTRSDGKSSNTKSNKEEDDDDDLENMKNFKF
jgi:splicing factor 3B subunit 2